MRCNGEVNAIILSTARLQWVWFKGWCQSGFFEIFDIRAAFLKAHSNSCKWNHPHLLCHCQWRIICSLKLPYRNFYYISLNIFKSCSCDAACLPVCKQSLPLSLPLQMVLEKVMEASFLTYLLRWTSCPMRLVQKVSSEAQKLSDFLYPGLFCMRSVFREMSSSEASPHNTSTVSRVTQH